MIFTHVLLGGLLGTGIGLLYPDLMVFAVGAGFIGGAAPDLDMIFTHRRTLHYPILWSVASVPLGIVAFIWPGPGTMGAFSFLLAAATHSLTDILGGGKEMRPWLETDDRAVFNHVAGRWIAPRRIFYDGSGTDLVLSMVLALLLYRILPSRYGVLIIGLGALAVVYTILRRWITQQISEEYQTFSSYIQSILSSTFGKT